MSRFDYSYYTITIKEEEVVVVKENKRVCITGRTEFFLVVVLLVGVPSKAPKEAL